MKLDVRVRGRTVASLFREGSDYVLRYVPQTPAADFVSLTMPVRHDSWRWPQDLHPFFRQNLPEGYLLGVIREAFGPLLDGTDFSLLGVVGASGIGRVSVVPEGAGPSDEPTPLDIAQLLKAENTEAHFSALVRQYARSAISGVVPKFLAVDGAVGDRAGPNGTGEAGAGLDAAGPLGKPTLRTRHHIIKGSDESTPYLGFNEHHSMQVLARLKTVPVARTRMSDDGRVLVVDRFDVDEHGNPTHGVEDACSLLGLPPHEKYATTTERVLAVTRPYLSVESARQSLEQLGWLLLANHVLRNADCHARNIALYYTGLNDVRYTPICDVVTTRAYPRYASNPPALPIGGRQSWQAASLLEKFFQTRLGIAPPVFARMLEALCDAATDTGREMIRTARNEPRWHGVAKQMLHAWNEGMQSLNRQNLISLPPALGEEMRAAGFSDPEPPERSRRVIGQSELLAPRKTKRRKR